MLLSSESAKKKEMSQHKFSRFLVLDFEATCIEYEKINPQEIIEWPTLLLDQDGNEISHFHEFVKPQAHPELSKFCTGLTGITQEQVDTGFPFLVVLEKHREWLKSHQLLDDDDNLVQDCMYVTDGNWDLKTCIVENCYYHKIPVPAFMKNWINQRIVVDAVFPGHGHDNIPAQLELFGLELTGRLHSGIDDCRNMVRVWQQLLTKQWITEDFVSCVEKKIKLPQNP